MLFVEKISAHINRVLVFIAGLFLILMIALTCANIFLRIVWLPIRGTYELMGFMGAVLTAFALGYTQIKRGHISVNVLVNSFSEKTQRVLNCVNHTVCMFFFAIAAWKISEKAAILRKTGEVSETLHMAYHPFTLGVALGCAVLALVYFIDMAKSVGIGNGKSLSAEQHVEKASK